MNIKTIQDILPLIERPSRYLGSEINRVKKNLDRVKLRIALAFPDLYEIGMSHFGLQVLYHVLNSHKEIAAEMVFAPWVDMEAYLKSSNIPIVSLESHRPLNSFDIIGFSLLYELNFTNILTLLDLAKIPFLSSKRDASYPFIIAGGPCTCNPEPVADLFDAMVIGDGERVVIEMSRIWFEWKEGSNNDKEALLKMWSGIDGVYIPAFFEPKFDRSGLQTLLPKFSDYKAVTRATIDDLDKSPFPDAPIIPYGKPVHDRLRLEVARGCTRGCRFCQAGMIYRPVRERSPETLLALTDSLIAATGYNELSLLSLSTGDYGCIIPLTERLMAQHENHVAISLPSLRAGTLTPELINLIKRVRKTGFTIAPEAGSQRLRNVINKNITEKEIVDTVSDAFGLGWQVIKLYFMVGLPTETDDDLQAIVDLVNNLRKIKTKGKRHGKINVSVTTFIPKPHTPFQWASQISLTESRERIDWLRNNLKMPGVHFKWQNPEVSILEGLWARGDRRLSRLLIAAYKRGCRFDSWSDKFRFRLWKEALAAEGTDIDFYTVRIRDMKEPLPWDCVDIKVSKSFLKQEWEKGLNEEHTPDCRRGNCNACGVCNFKTIKPKIFEVCKEKFRPDLMETALQGGSIISKEASYKRLAVSYSKQGQAKYFGHLETVNIFSRALRRAKIPVKLSEGFHPMPKLSFGDPIPQGMESLDESLSLTVPDSIEPQTVITGLNDHLPEGLTAHSCQPAPAKTAKRESESTTYLVTIKNGFFDKKELERFTKSSEFIVARANRNGMLKRVDLKNMVLKIDMPAPHRLQMTLRSEPAKTVRPLEVITKVFSLSEETVKQAAVIKLKGQLLYFKQ